MNHSLPKEETSLESLLVEVTDEFLERLKGGEEPNVEEYAERYPAIAEALRQMLAALKLMRSSPVAPDLSADSDLQPLANAETLGDFRLVQEIGRGGMGVVYEAVQLSLGRRVALKVLPFVSTLDPKQLQRFRNEAQAAAHLHHQHIVPVYATGCERGVHYYAMQLIEGQTLAEAIADLRSRNPDLEKAPSDIAATGPYKAHAEGAVSSLNSGASDPTVAALSTERSTRGPAFFRAVAQLGVQAAEALEHAHQLGVVHRDIKPANLLVDKRGQVWVTDFGLAHCQSQAGLTMTGDLVGTLRYMSPEQALAKRIVIDHRTDVYSLGATLYELLTQEPAFSGRDREELLRQIAFEEPRAPRCLNKTIPADLETIVLKAMEKNPTDRYGTAQELADDLDLFLKDELIRARRPTLSQRMKKWARRHQGVVRAAAVGLALAMAGLVLSTVLVWQEKVKKEKALKENVAALAKTEAALNEADIQRRQARQAVEDMYTQVAQEWLADQPRMTDVQRKFLQKALHYFQEFAKEESPDPALRQQTAAAYGRVGQIQGTLGHHDEALQATRQAITLFEGLVTDLPRVADYQDGLAKGCNDLGDMLRYTGSKREAEIALRRAVDLQEKLVVADPKVLGYRDGLAAYYLNIGVLLTETNRPQEAEETYLKALRIREELAREHPNVAGYQDGLANISFNLAGLLDEAGRNSQAAQLWGQAAATWKKLADEYPHVPRFRDRLARTYISLSNLRELTQPEQSLEDARQARVLLEKLTADFPRLPVYRKHLAITLSNLGNRHKSKGRLTEAEELYRQAISHLRKLADEFPNMPGHQFSLGLSLHNLAVLLRDQGKLEQALDVARQAIGSELTAVKIDSKYREYSLGLANGYVNLTETLLRLGNHKEAAEVAPKAPQLFPEESLVAADAARLLARSVRLAEKDATLSEVNRRQATQAYGNRAVELLRTAIQNRLPNAGGLKNDPALEPLRPRDDFKKLTAGVEEPPKQR